MPKNSAKRSAGAFGSNHLLRILNASEDHRISRVGALKALGVPKTRATLDRLSDVINVLEADSRLEKIGGHSICLPCAPKYSRGAPTKFQSKVLEALEQAETQQLSRIGALKAMGLQRTRKNLDRLARAIDALHLEKTVQKLGGHSVCLLSGDIGSGKRGRGDKNGETENSKLQKTKERTEEFKKALSRMQSREDNDKNHYLEWIRIKETRDEIKLDKIQEMELDPEEEDSISLGSFPGVPFKQSLRLPLWTIESMTPSELKISLQRREDYKFSSDIYDTVFMKGTFLINQELEEASEQIDYRNNAYQTTVDAAMEVILNKQKEIKLLLGKNSDDVKEGQNEIGLPSDQEQTVIQQAQEEIQAKWVEIDKVTKQFVKKDAMPLKEKTGINKRRLEMLKGAKILKLTLPETKITTLTFPAHKLVEIPYVTRANLIKDSSGGILFRFSPPTSDQEVEEENTQSTGQQTEDILQLQQENKAERIIVNKLVPKNDDSIITEEKEWERVSLSEKEVNAIESIEETEQPFSFPTKFGTCSVYYNAEGGTVIHVQMEKAASIWN